MKALFAGITMFFGILFIGTVLWGVLEGAANYTLYKFSDWSAGGWIVFIIYSGLAVSLAAMCGCDVYDKESKKEGS